MMYFLTNKKDINIWEKYSLKELSDYRGLDNIEIYEVYENTLIKMDINYFKWVSKSNVHYKPKFLQRGDKIKTYNSEIYMFLSYEESKEYMNAIDIESGKKNIFNSLFFRNNIKGGWLK